MYVCNYKKGLMCVYVCMYAAKMTSNVENKTPLAFLHELYKDSAMERKPLVTDRMNLCSFHYIYCIYIHTYTSASLTPV